MEIEVPTIGSDCCTSLLLLPAFIVHLAISHNLFIDSSYSPSSTTSSPSLDAKGSLRFIHINLSVEVCVLLLHVLNLWVISNFIDDSLSLSPVLSLVLTNLGGDEQHQEWSSALCILCPLRPLLDHFQNTLRSNAVYQTPFVVAFVNSLSSFACPRNPCPGRYSSRTENRGLCAGRVVFYCCLF